jgi:hypothetical protein
VGAVSRAPATDARAWRAVALAIATAAITALGHLLGAPGRGCGDVVAPMLLVCGMAFVLARGQWTTRRVFLVLLVGQVGFHLLTWIGSSTSDPTISSRMVASHVLAALVAAWVLQRGDAACEALWHVLTSAAPQRLVPVVAEPRRARILIGDSDRIATPRHLSVLEQRGPPAAGHSR